MLQSGLISSSRSEFAEMESCKNYAHIIRIQSFVRKQSAKKKLRNICLENIEHIFDQKYNSYFYHNIKTGRSSWVKPFFLGDEINLIESSAASKIQQSIRRKLK